MQTYIEFISESVKRKRPDKALEKLWNLIELKYSKNLLDDVEDFEFVDKGIDGGYCFFVIGVFQIKFYKNSNYDEGDYDEFGIAETPNTFYYYIDFVKGDEKVHREVNTDCPFVKSLVKYFQKFK